MGVIPVDWNVVVAGRWNPAIFTPSAIARKLFLVEQTVPIEVLVPLDSPGRPLFKYQNISITVSASRLVVQPEVMDFANVSTAMEVASRAVNWLGETPFSAAGINIRYQATNPGEPLTALLTHPSDFQLSDIGFNISARGTRRSVAWGDGQINIEVSSAIQEHGPAIYFAVFNFHFPCSNAVTLAEWLRQPIEDIESKSDLLLTRYVQEQAEILNDDEPT